MLRKNASGTVPKIDLLKIDKDCVVDRDWIRDYVKTAITICRRFKIKILWIKNCPSKRKGLHFYIKIGREVEPAFANRLQWLLGDDARRVDFNRARIESGLVEWNKLFEVASRKVSTIYRPPQRADS